MTTLQLLETIRDLTSRTPTTAEGCRAPQSRRRPGLVGRWAILVGLALSVGGPHGLRVVAAAEPPRAFFDEQTYALARVDLARGDLATVLPWIALAAGNDDWDNVGAELPAAQRQLLAAGVDELVVVLSLADPVAEIGGVLLRAADPAAAGDLLGKSSTSGEWYKNLTRHEDWLVTGRGNTVRRLVENQPVSRPELEQLWERLVPEPAGIGWAPSPELRRVMVDFFPHLPPRVGQVPAGPLFEGLVWLAGGWSDQPSPGLWGEIACRDPAAAGAWAEALPRVFADLERWPDSRGQWSGIRQLGRLGPHLRTVVDGDRVTVRPAASPEVATLLAAATTDARQASTRITLQNRAKQIALAMHGYLDREQTFPTPASLSPEGRPLLSWRVQLLPFLGDEGRQLHAQFRLDQPWDSEHNRQLIEAIPEVFQVPGSTLPRGRTCWAVPTSEGTLFAGGRGRGVREVIDGTSRTILFVEVADEHAPIWTAPDDIAPTAEDPARGLGGRGGPGFVASLADGAAIFFASNRPAAELWTYFTAAARDIPPRN